MAEAIEMKAAARENIGKGSSRVTRREGRVPCIVYGDKDAPLAVTLDDKDLWQQVRTGQFLNTIYMLDIDGKVQRVIPKDVQMDPVRDVPLHVDFLRLGEGASVTVEIPVQFINENDSPGLKRGGVLNIVRHSIELRCVAESIPENLIGDLAGLEIGDSMHVSAIKLPEGCELTVTDRDFTVATIVGRMAEIVDEDDEDAEGVEGEEGEEGEEGAEGEAAEGDGGDDGGDKE